VVLSIGDVAGTGVVAAAAMGAARQMIRGLAQTLDNPVAVLNAVDRALRIESGGLTITAIVGFLSGARPADRLARGHDRRARSRRPGRRQYGRAVHRWAAEATRDPVEGEERLRAALANDAFAAHLRNALFLYERVLTRRAKGDVALLVIELPRMFPFAARRTAVAASARARRRRARADDRSESDEVRLMAKGKEAKKEKKKPKKDAKPKAK
jgi:hypothetical protein